MHLSPSLSIQFNNGRRSTRSLLSGLYGSRDAVYLEKLLPIPWTSRTLVWVIWSAQPELRINAGSAITSSRTSQRAYFDSLECTQTLRSDSIPQQTLHSTHFSRREDVLDSANLKSSLSLYFQNSKAVWMLETKRWSAHWVKALLSLESSLQNIPRISRLTISWKGWKEINLTWFSHSVLSSILSWIFERKLGLLSQLSVNLSAFFRCGADLGRFVGSA